MRYLDFEEPIRNVEEEIEAIRRAAPEEGGDAADRLAVLERKLADVRAEVFRNLTAIQRAKLSRHPDRPHALDVAERIAEDILFLHGDRAFGDDPAVFAALAVVAGREILLIGQEKGRETRERIARSFGMAHPEGYRKAVRLMKLAARFRRPVVTLVDTPGAYPGTGAEERGQAEAIAAALRETAAIPTPIVAAVIGEGGSGGALGLALADRVLMLENAIYSVISPEGCAAILFADAGRAAEAAEAMRITARDLEALGVIDEVVPEPPGGAHRDPDASARALADALRRHLDALEAETAAGRLVAGRRERFRRMGRFEEAEA